MPITIQMGDRPKPTATISLASKNYSSGTLTCTFDWFLNALGGSSYWGYGVNLQYSTDNVNFSTLNIIPAGTRHWSAKNGSVIIVINNVSSTPQTFYFRLNSVQPTSASPGKPVGYSVNVALASKITILGNFDIEGEHWLEFTKYFDGAYMDLYLWVWKDGNDENTGMRIGESSWEGYRGNYQSGEHTKFNSMQRAQIYNLAMPQTTVGTKVNVRYILKTYIGPSGTYIGEDSKVVQGIIRGSIKVNDNGTWKNCVPFVRFDNSWKPCSASVKNNGTWRDGQ